LEVHFTKSGNSGGASAPGEGKNEPPSAAGSSQKKKKEHRKKGKESLPGRIRFEPKAIDPDILT